MTRPCAVPPARSAAVLTSLRAGNDTRYANASHGMEVPANAAYFTVMGPHGVPHSFLVATTAIRQGDEILTDYGELSDAQQVTIV